MHTTKLRKVGGSVMLAVPPTLLDLLQLQAGAKVGVAVESGRLIVEARPRPRYTLAELLAQCESTTRRSKGGSKRDEQWLTSKPVGHELV